MCLIITKNTKCNAVDISSRYETEDQSEYRTDEDEVAGGHPPQTDLDERETEIGWKSSQNCLLGKKAGAVNLF